MSAISIVINAVNNAKAAFDSVGNQVVDLNKKLNKAAAVMRGLFVAGIAAKFVKDLVGASSQTEKLEGIIGRIKERFGDFATTIGDGLVDILGFLEAPIIKIADFIGAIIDGIKRVAAVAAAVLTGSSFKEALNIAEEVLATEKAERAARKEAQKTAEEKRKLEEQAAANAIKEAERVAKEREKLAQEIAKLEGEIAKQQNKMAEAQMTDAELLAKRKEESEKAYNDYVTALLEGRTKDQLEAFNEYLKLQEEILKIESEISDAAAKVAQQKEKAAKNSAIEAEAEKRRLQQKSIEEKAMEKINALEAQRQELIQKQAALIAKSEDLRKRAIDKNYNEEQKQAEKSKQKEEKRFDALLASAKRKVARQTGGGFGPRLTESERLALESDQAKKAAAEAEAQAKQLEDAARQAQIDSEMHLANIEKDIKDLLAMKE
jgi:chemotaxis protein histidine kinase CheA